MHLNMTRRPPMGLRCRHPPDIPETKCWQPGCCRSEPGWLSARFSARKTTTGTVVGLTGQEGQEGRSTTTTMFMYPTRRSHQEAATIRQDRRRQTVRGELLVGLAVWVALGQSADQAMPVDQEESADQAMRVDREESADQAMSVDQGESADQATLVDQEESADQGESVGLVELAGGLDLTLPAERVLPTGWGDHLLGHTIRPKPNRTEAPTRTGQSRISRRQALFPTIRGPGTRTEI